MDRFFENLKRQAEENPTLALGVATGLIIAVSKLIDSTSSAKNSRAWAREVNRRVAQTKK